MSADANAEPKAQRAVGRPPFDRIALVLQGGGALGSYQAGVYQALAEADLHPDWVGISIGAINSALIAGNPPERRVERLRAFWETVSQPPFGMPTIPGLELLGDLVRALYSQTRALGILAGGAPGFFTPRVPPPFLLPAGSPGATSFYDVTPLRETLGRLVDFERLNAGPTRFSVGAVNVRSGNFIYFDNTTHRIGLEHVIASGSLPPGFPTAEIDGEHYWDGGIVSNSPLQWLVQSRPRRDTLVFQVDLWDARGDLPRDLLEADVRLKDIRYSSRTRANSDQFRHVQRLRRAVARLLRKLPAELRADPGFELVASEADETVYNLVHLIYRARKYEGTSKDYEFSRRTMEEHWASGYEDARLSLAEPRVLQRPEGPDGVYVYDLGKNRHDEPPRGR
jgi:NTE family protein